MKSIRSDDPSWCPIEIPTSIGNGRSFVSGDPGGDRIRIHYFVRDAGDAVLAKVSFGLEAEGPPGCAHGGSLAAVLDEAMGAAAWLAGHAAVAARLVTEFRGLVALDTEVHVTAWVDRVEERKVTTRAVIASPDGATLFAEGEALFLVMQGAQFEEIADRLKAKLGQLSGPG